MNMNRFRHHTLLGVLIVTAFMLPRCAAQPRQGAPNSANAATGTRGLQSAPPSATSYDLPNNIYGAHLLVESGAPGTRGHKHLRWARHLVGRWGYAKTLFGEIDKNIAGPKQGWVDYVNACYELELIPFLRLAGWYRGDGWIKPEADSPGDYTSIAQAVKRVVEGIPRSDKCPLYIEIWNEPNLTVEWSGKTNVQEYADFFVACSEAIRSIGDERIKVLNGGLALGPDWTRMLCEANPAFITGFDLWSTHPYPMNRPAWFNHHAGNVPADSHFAIDAHVLELAELKKAGRDNVKVMITETGWDLGNNVYLQSEGHPIIDEYNRSDYIMRAFRDYWPQWPEVVAVFPFEFCNEGWERFDWVYPESDINPDGSPTKPHYQYTVVAALAKPTDETGAINGTITVDKLGVRLEGAVVRAAGQSFTTDPMGNFYFAKVKPGEHTVRISKPGFQTIEKQAAVGSGRNTVVDIALEATSMGRLVGTVTSGDTGKPLEGVRVQLSPGDVETRTDRAGKFVLSGQIPASYELKATLDGHYEYDASGVQVEANRTANYDFVLGRRPKDLPTRSMINNVSMEAGGGGGGKDWIALGFEPLHIDSKVAGLPPGEVVDTVAHTGRRSQELKLLPPETVIRQITHYGTAKPGTQYVAGAWIKVDGEGDAWITFDFTEDSGAVVHRAGVSEKVGARDGWTWVMLEGEAPDRSRRLSLNLHTQGKRGAAWFDDAIIAETKAK